MKKVSIIIPCYNEEQALPYLYAELVKVRSELKDYEFEYILVDDGSRDRTVELLKEQAEKDSDFKYISFSRNFGKEAAMYAGFTYATGDYVTIMDADLQDPPSLLPKMLDILEHEDYDSVATKRSTRKGEPKLRSFFARKFYKIINRISEADIVDGARDFRLMKRQMVDEILKMTEYNRFSKGIFGWIGFKTYWLSYENIERVAGKTKWNFWKLFKYSIEGITDFSNAPLNISFVFCIISFILSLGCFITNIVFKCIWDWSLLSTLDVFALILFIAAILFGLLGILGIYIGKIFSEAKGRQVFIVRDTNMWKNNK